MVVVLQALLVAAIAGAVLWLMVVLRRRVDSLLVRLMVDVMVTFCLWFIVVAAANALTVPFGRDPDRAEGGEWSFYVVFFSSLLGWLLFANGTEFTDRARRWILGVCLGVGLAAATAANVSASPPV